MAYLEIQNVGKVFNTDGGKTFEALKGVNLQIEEGEFIAVIGHSGCGKSTLLNLVAGLYPMSSGRIVVDGSLVTEPGPDRMVAFQNHSLLPWLTVRQNIELAVNAVHKSRSETERKALVDEHLAMVNLNAAADKKPGQISGGMKQRVGIARALVTQPKVLLLDEPFGALDALTRGRLQEQLLKIWEAHRITVMMITHDVEEALLLSDRIVMMSNGPSARVGEIMTVELPRPRTRMEVINNPNYYRQRNELLYFLSKSKKEKAARTVGVPVSAPARVPAVKVGSSFGLEKSTLDLGFIALSDCAPLVIAKEKGFFAKHGLEVNLSRETSWKTVLQGILEDRLDASQMVTGMPLGQTLGIFNKTPITIVTAMTLSRNGNAITLSRKFHDLAIRSASDLKNYLDSNPGGKELTFGMVYPSSMHNILLRHWLASAGIDPDKDVNLVVIPPAQMVSNLQAGNIDGYCVGEPWNSRAIHEGLGFVPATSLDILPGHAEKVLGMKETWAEAHPKTHVALVKALLEACQFCDQPENRDQVIQLISQKAYVNADPIYSSMGLSGSYNYGFGRAAQVPDFNVFFKNHANFSTRSEKLWVLTQMARWGLVMFPRNWEEVIERVYRLDVYRQACHDLGFEVPEANYQSLTLPDGSVLDPNDPIGYINSFAIKHDVTITDIKLQPRLLTVA
jgi:nitrate/nitrite transport system ATP-binding protein